MNRIKIVTLTLLILLLVGCATTNHLPEGSIMQCRKGFVTVYAPHVVEAVDYYHGIKGPVWVWETTFIEKSGVVGVTITHRVTKITAPDGRVWQAVDPATGKFLDKIPLNFRIKAGGSARRIHKTYDTEHNMCNGICTTTFYGFDDNGEEVVLPTMIFLSHTNCPKKKF